MRRVVGVLFVTLMTLSAFTQPQGDRQPPSQQGPPNEESQFLFFEAINFVADEANTSRIDILYRIDNQFFVGVKNSDASLPFPFKRRGEVLVELLDKKGSSIARDIHRFQVGANTTETEPDVKAWYEGVASFTVVPGEYSVVFEIDDLESERKFLDKNRKVIAKKFDANALATSSPLLVQPAEADSQLTPINFGSNLLFGKGATLYLQLHSKQLSKEPISVEYSIATQPFMHQDPQIVLTDTIQQLAITNRSSPKIISEELPVRYSLQSPARENQAAAVLIPLKAEQLPLRPFMLNMKIKQGSLEASVQQPIRMVWPEMPMSLRDIDFALEALRHITKEDELDSLKSGSREVRLKHLEEFWKKKDRTPETEYNQDMYEYYRRVDFTMRSFSSMRALDGYKSDRGRIYILYGPPTKTERNLNPTIGFQEIWVYEKQNKKFVFADQSKSGNYTLVATQNL